MENNIENNEQTGTEEKAESFGKKFWLPVIIALVAVVAYLAYAGTNQLWPFGSSQRVENQVQSFEECAAAGNPVMESYPRQCRSADGQLFVEKIDETENWKIYRNEEFGFEFQYPSDRTPYREVHETEEILIPATSTSSKVIIAENEPHVFCCEPLLFAIEVLDNQIEDLKNWVEDNYVDLDTEYRVKSRGFEIFKGADAYRMYSEFGIDSPGNIIAFNHRNRGIIIRYSDDINLFTQILSTFKFLN